MVQPLRPARRASGKNASTSTTEIRFGIFMVSRSVAAAKATANGNTIRTAVSNIAPDPASRLHRTRQPSPGRGVGTMNGPQPGSTQSQKGLRTLHGGRDRVEGIADLRAETTGRGNDADSDQGSDQAVFDGRGARLILHKTLDLVLHDDSPTCRLAHAPGLSCARRLPRHKRGQARGCRLKPRLNGRLESAVSGGKPCPSDPGMTPATERGHGAP